MRMRISPSKEEVCSLSQPKQYFKGQDLDKAVDWLKKHMQSGDVIAEIEGKHIETGADVSCSGLVIQAESGFGKPDTLVLRLDKNEPWTSEKMISIGKPNASGNISVAAQEIFLTVKTHGVHEGKRHGRSSDRRSDSHDEHDRHDDHDHHDR